MGQAAKRILMANFLQKLMSKGGNLSLVHTRRPLQVGLLFKETGFIISVLLR